MTNAERVAVRKSFYWAFPGYALSYRHLPKARQEAVLDELIRMALR